MSSLYLAPSSMPDAARANVLRRGRRVVALSLVSLAAALSLGGCESATPTGDSAASETVSQEAALAVVPNRPDVPTPSLSEGAREQEDKRGAEVDWEAVAGHPHIGGAFLNEALATMLDAADVPVLLPNDPSLLWNAAGNARPGFYTAQVPADGYTLEFFGTRLENHVPVQVAPDQRIVEGEPMITISEGIPAVSFSRFGVSYWMGMECDRGPADPRCTNPDVLLQVFEDLVVVGGQP